jgi:cytochrome c oxidase subunit 3
LISLGFSLLFSYPLLSYYSFTIPISNLLILVFSSVPIQVAQIFIKIGFFILTMEGLGQSVCCGFLFIILQCKEFLYSYFSLSYSMIGCIFYFTTGLHGIHVLFGLFFFFILILIFYFSFYNPIFFIEYSSSILLCSYYWHFIDWI